METFDMVLFLKALGLALAIEGVLWAGFTRAMRDAALYMARQPLSLIRTMGLVMLGIGVAICALAGLC